MTMLSATTSTSVTVEGRIMEHQASALFNAEQSNKAVRDWAHLPAVAVQAIGLHCCPASRAKLRLICRPWQDALATQFATLFVGPGSPAWWPCSSSLHVSNDTPQQQLQLQQAVCQALSRVFPAVTSVQLTGSSSREYGPSYTQDLAVLLASQPHLTHLTLQELHELDDFDTLDPASLWDVLAAALPVLAGRLRVLRVAGCFWNRPELFGGLRQLTALTELRLADTPLETAHELGVVVSLTQLVTLELGIIFDGSSAHHDVPRALEDLSNLQSLRALSLPIWRRSLGGRAHPLAPALSAALRCLTALTSLAVDGKFSQLGVVSSLTNLRELASAAPLSKEGWQAICHLPHLTLLTSLTPPHEALKLNPTRPHPGCDLATLAPKSSLQGIDVAVLRPEHLAALGQFTALQRLNLRCAATFHAVDQQGQLLTALACLPPGLTSLSIGPLLPLSPQLLASIASSCPKLKALTARFTHALETVLGQPEAAATSRLWLQQQRMPYAHGGAAAAVLAESEFEPMHDDETDAQGQQQEQEEQPHRSSTISSALAALRALRRLELVLVSEPEADLPGVDLTPRRSSSYGGTGQGSSPGTAAAAAAGPRSSSGSAGTAVASAGAACVEEGGSSNASSILASELLGGIELQLELLPKGLRHLVLSGPWLLSLHQAPATKPAAAVTAAGARAAGALQLAASESISQSVLEHLQQVQQLQQQVARCQLCHGRTVPGRQPQPQPLQTWPQPEGAGSSKEAALCECTKSLGMLQVSGSSTAKGPHAAGTAAAVATAAPSATEAKQESSSSSSSSFSVPHPTRQQQDQQDKAAHPGRLPAAAALVAASAWQRSHSSSDSKANSPTRAAVLGLKRPASYSAVQQHGSDAHGTTAAYADSPALRAASVSDFGLGSISSSLWDHQSAQQLAGHHFGDVFVVDKPNALQKRSRSYNSMAVADTLAGKALAGSDSSSSEPLIGPVPTDQSEQQLQQQQHLPALAEMCLFKCQVSYQALSALVQVAGASLSKLQLLQLSVDNSSTAAVARTGSSSIPSLLGRLQHHQRQRAQATAATALSTELLLRLPIVWSNLVEWHIHPYQLWGMLSTGCLGQTDAGKDVGSSGHGSFSDAAAANLAENETVQQLPRRPPHAAQPQQGLAVSLQHVSQLRNLRHLYVVNRPTPFSAAAPPMGGLLPGAVPLPALPLDDPAAMLKLLTALQTGLQQLPVLRQLLLYLGPVAPLHPELPDHTADMWAETGEQLLAGLPAVRVRHFHPGVCQLPAGAVAKGAAMVVPVVLPGPAAAAAAGASMAAAAPSHSTVGAAAPAGFMLQQKLNGQQPVPEPEYMI